MMIASGNFSTASDATPQESSTSTTATTSTPTKHVQIDPIETWKGLIGVKEKTLIIPHEYSSHTWVTDLRQCANFEDKLKETFRTIRTTANAENDTDKRERITSFITDEEQDLQRSNLQILENLVETREITLPAETPQACEIYPSPSLGSEICGDLVQDITLLQDNLVEALSSEDSSRNGGLSGIMSLHRTYQDHLQSFRQTLSRLKVGEIPTELLSLIETNCSVLYRQCTKPQINRNTLLYSKLIKILAIGKAETGHKVFITIGTPCISSEDVVHQHRLMAMPYQLQDKFMKISLSERNSHIWVHHPSITERTLIQQPWGCKDLNTELAACPPQIIQALPKSTDHILTAEPARNVGLEISNMQLGTIVSAPEEITLVTKCANQTPADHKIKGVNYIRAQQGCSIKVKQTDQRIRSDNSSTDIMGTIMQTTLQALTQSIQNIISIKNNEFDIAEGMGLAADLIPQLIDVTKHFEHNWIYYVWTTTVLMAIGFTFCSLWMYLMHKQKRQRLRFKRKRSRTYVLPRQMTSTA